MKNGEMGLVALRQAEGKTENGGFFNSFYGSFLASRRICFTSGQCNVEIRVLILINNLFPPF